MDVTSQVNDDNLYLTFTSEFATGLQLEFLGDISAINLVDNHNFILVSNLGDLNRCVVYSMNNKAFDELTLEIEGGDKVNIKDINIIAGDSNNSILYDEVNSAAMPPYGSGNDPLNANQINLY